MEVQAIKQRFGIIGNSSLLLRSIDIARQVAPTDLTVLITGESGTGKEVFPQIIHQLSARKHGPYIAVNCGAIPEGTIDSELFGHEKGSFTGATFRRIGRFEEADGGTLFLDEIGEMHMNMQTKLLRILQEKEIVRVGSNKPVKIDCRIIVATNKNLKEEVKKGNFREDLFYRLLGLPIELPPLRDRANDILILARHFIEIFCNENNIPPKILSVQSQNKLLNYHFPGNIRELKSVIELAVTLSGKNEIEPGDLVLDQGDPLSVVTYEDLTLREYQLKIIKATLKKYSNDIKLVAEKLDIGVSTIYRLLKEELE